MECKVFPVLYCSDWDADWNISRMECKVTIKAVISRSITIGIYPEWNVKEEIYEKFSLDSRIGIYPEWNVKNINIEFYKKATSIGIYPEWNVKASRTIPPCRFGINWNISRMECKV